MVKVEFLRKYVDSMDNEIYGLLIDNIPCMYDRTIDIVETYGPWVLTERLELPTDVLKAFHKAWNPAEYEDSDKLSKPQGEPVTLKNKRVGGPADLFQAFGENMLPTVNMWGQQIKDDRPWFALKGMKV